MDKNLRKDSVLFTWFIIWLLVILIFLKGQFAFVAVGNPGQPTWNYGSVEDIPGASPYAMYPLLPNPQHIQGRDGK